MLKAGSYGKGHLFPTERGTPQGGVVSPVLSNILLTPFDREMRLRGYQLTRYADDWVVTCKSAAEARSAVDAACRILKQLGVELHPQKTRIVHVLHGFEFLGYKIKRGKKLHLPESKICSQARSGALYAYPREKSIQRFQDQVRQRTKRRVPLKTKELIAELNPLRSVSSACCIPGDRPVRRSTPALRSAIPAHQHTAPSHHRISIGPASAANPGGHVQTA